MTEFALLPLLAVPLLVECTYHGLRIHAKRHFLYLNRLEQLRGFSLRLFCGGLLLFSLRLFSFFLLLFWGFGLGSL
jgi:hypothetical protein